jgi:hypothetical protein
VLPYFGLTALLGAGLVAFVSGELLSSVAVLGPMGVLAGIAAALSIPRCLGCGARLTDRAVRERRCPGCAETFG